MRAVTLYRDDKKSLGFNIEKGELGSSPSVLISNLTHGGPADQCGSLQVGDQILSVDGQKILGYAYEKVRKWPRISLCMVCAFLATKLLNTCNCKAHTEQHGDHASPCCSVWALQHYVVYYMY